MAVKPADTGEVDMNSLDQEISSIIDDQSGAAEEPSNQLDFDDDDLSILDENHDEVSTKLELACAYLDMGDGEGARDILNEVIENTFESRISLKLE